MFRIYDGRDKFYQWDIDRKLIVEDETIKEVHFCNRTDDCSLVCETYKEDGLTIVNVPNILLQSDWRIRVYAYVGYTKFDKCFEVVGRTKPADYVYTETEIREVEAIVDAAVEEALKDIEIPTSESGIKLWESGKEYKEGDIVYKPNLNDGIYDYDILIRCLANHTSNTDFGYDIFEYGYWEELQGVGALSAYYAIEAENAYYAGYADEAGYVEEANTAEYANLAGAAECDNEGRIIHETYPTWDDLDSSTSGLYTDLYDYLEIVVHFWEYPMEEAEDYLYDATEIVLIFKKNGSDKFIYSHYVPYDKDSYGYKTVGHCAHQKVSIMNDTNAYWYYDGSKICLENADGYTIESIMLKH